MKIVISSDGKDLKSEVDSRFGRCKYFMLVDAESMDYEKIENESATATGGAGIQAAQKVADKGAEAVITGNIGPNAYKTLSAAGIKVYTGAKGSIKEVVEEYKKGNLNEAENPSVGSHFGTKGAGRGKGRGKNI